MVELTRVASEVVTEHTVLLVTITTQVELTDFVEHFNLKIMPVAALVSFPATTFLIETAFLSFKVGTRKRESRSLGKLFVLAPAILPSAFLAIPLLAWSIVLLRLVGIARVLTSCFVIWR